MATFEISAAGRVQISAPFPRTWVAKAPWKVHDASAPFGKSSTPASVLIGCATSSPVAAEKSRKPSFFVSTPKSLQIGWMRGGSPKSESA